MQLATTEQTSLQDTQPMAESRQSGQLGKRSVTAERSPNDQAFGAGPGMLKNVIEGLISMVASAAGTALSVAYAVGYYAAGGAIGTAAAIGVGGTVASIAIGYLLFELIKE